MPNDTVSLADINAGFAATAAPSFIQTNLISDGSSPAAMTDPNLVNPWGVSMSPTSPLWISENGTGLASVDSITGATITLNTIPAVTIPAPATTTTTPPTDTTTPPGDDTTTPPVGDDTTPNGPMDGTGPMTGPMTGPTDETMAPAAAGNTSTQIGRASCR